MINILGKIRQNDRAMKKDYPQNGKLSTPETDRMFEYLKTLDDVEKWRIFCNLYGQLELYPKFIDALKKSIGYVENTQIKINLN